ncbi:hypothetical protein [Microcoleus sp. herbarium14]
MGQLLQKPGCKLLARFEEAAAAASRDSRSVFCHSKQAAKQAIGTCTIKD